MTWAALAAFALYLLPSLLLLRHYQQFAFDLGIYDQSLWLLAHGQTFNTVAGIHVFGAHLSPVLVLLAPLSLVPGGAVPELIFQSGVLASGVFAVARLARLAGTPVAPMVTIYVAHPAVFTGAWYGFRPWNLAAPALAWAAVILLRRPSFALYTSVGLGAFLLREDIPMWVGLLGLLLVLQGRLALRHWIAGSAVLAAGTVAASLVVIPLFSPVDSYIYLNDLASSVSPSLFVLSVVGRILFLVMPLGLGTAPFRSWSFVPLLVPVAALATRDGATLLTQFHYDMVFVPLMLVVVALEGLRPSLLGVIAFSLLVSVALGPLQPGTRIRSRIAPNPLLISENRTEALDQVRNRLVAIVTNESTLSLPERLVPHYSERPEVFVFPYPFDRNRPEPYPMDCPHPDIVVTDPEWDVRTPNWHNTVESEYQVLYDHGDYRIYQQTGAATSSECGPADDPSP